MKSQGMSDSMLMEPGFTAGHVPRDLYHCGNGRWIDVTQYHAWQGASFDVKRVVEVRRPGARDLRVVGRSPCRIRPGFRSP